MKKIINSAIAASIVLASTTAAAATPTIERGSADVIEAEGLEGQSGWIIALLAALVAAGVIFLIEDNEDEDLPTSP